MDIKPAVGEAADIIRQHLGAACNPGKPTRVEREGDEVVRRALLDLPTHHSMTFPEQLTQALSWPSQDLVALNRAANTTFCAAGWVVGPINTRNFYRLLAKVTAGSSTGTACTIVGAFFAGNTSNSLQAVTGAAWTWAQVTTGATINIANSATPTVCTAEIRADQFPSNTQWALFVINNQCASAFSAEVICAEGAYRPSSQFNNTAILGQSVT